MARRFFAFRPAPALAFRHMASYDVRVTLLPDKQVVDFEGVQVEWLPFGVRIDEPGVGFVIPAARVESITVTDHKVEPTKPFSAIPGD